MARTAQRGRKDAPSGPHSPGREEGGQFAGARETTWGGRRIAFRTYPLPVQRRRVNHDPEISACHSRRNPRDRDFKPVGHRRERSFDAEIGKRASRTGVAPKVGRCFPDRPI